MKFIGLYSKRSDVMIDWLNIECECGEKINDVENNIKICPKCGRGYITQVIQFESVEMMKLDDSDGALRAPFIIDEN